MINKKPTFNPLNAINNTFLTLVNKNQQTVQTQSGIPKPILTVSEQDVYIGLGAKWNDNKILEEPTLKKGVGIKAQKVIMRHRNLNTKDFVTTVAFDK